MALERLQKIMAAAGIASRRKAEEMIQQGLVSVNGQIVTQLGTKADPETDSIRVNEKLLKGAERHEYVVLNKPRGYVTTVSDPEGRPTVMELVHSRARLYPVGRLDFNSEGLLLLTNDGDLAHKLMKAASHIPKTYLVKVAGQPAEEGLRRLRTGVSIAEERHPGHRVKTAPAQIRVIKEAENPWLEVTLHEGRNRQIRKMFEEIGHHVEKIRRVRYGPLELDLEPGESRSLNAKEMAQLQRATDPRMQTRDRTEERRSSFADSRRTERPRRAERPHSSERRPPREGRNFQNPGSDKPFEKRPPRGEARPRREDRAFAEPRRDKPFAWRERPAAKEFETQDRSKRREDRGFPERKSDKPFERPERPAAKRFEDRNRRNWNQNKSRSNEFRDTHEQRSERGDSRRRDGRNANRPRTGFRERTGNDSRSEKFAPRGERKAFGRRKHQSRRDSNRPRSR